MSGRLSVMKLEATKLMSCFVCVWVCVCVCVCVCLCVLEQFI